MELTPQATTFSVLLIGFVLGLQHARDADHLAAVSTIVSEKKDLFAASLIGGFWGLGHTVSIFAVGAGVVFLKLQIPETVESKLEAVVGVMLVLLGTHALWKLFSARKIHIHTHKHGGRSHIHIHTHGEKAEILHHHFSPRSVVVGMVHGLAGSAALMLLIVPTISSPFIALAYILLFGIGSITGMIAMSFLIALLLHFTANRFNFLNNGIRLLAGIFSLCLGGFIVYEKLLAA